MGQRSCSVPGCERPHYGRGLCGAHWQRQRAENAGTCAMDGCERKIRARGWCNMHYQRWRKTGDPGAVKARPRANPETCTVDGCEKPFYGHGYCATHMRRWKKNGDPGPVETGPKVRQTCTFKECGRPAVSRGLCTGHAQQAKKGKPLAPLRPMHRSTIRNEHGLKRCHACKTWQEVTEFYPNRRHADGLSSSCRRCGRDRQLRRNYGLTVAQYEVMLAEQGGGCAICGTVPTDGRALHVDHDHACCPTRKKSCGQCVRGLLCEDCNRVLGMFADHIPRFESAIDYLKNGGVHGG